MGLLYGENCMILTSTVFDWSTRVTDRQTDRQTDGRNCDSVCALTAYAVARKKIGKISRKLKIAMSAPKSILYNIFKVPMPSPWAFAIMTSYHILGPPVAIFFFYSARDLRGLSADRRETLPHDRKWVQFKKTRSKIRGSSPQKIWWPKTCFFRRDFGRLRTSIANISGMEEDIDNRKKALQTTISPASADVIWWTLVYKRRTTAP